MLGGGGFQFHLSDKHEILCHDVFPISEQHRIRIGRWRNETGKMMGETQFIAYCNRYDEENNR